MDYLFLASLLAIFLVILWLPACSVAIRLKGMGVVRPFSGLRFIWPLQLMAAIGLIYLADHFGLHNPAGYSFAITAVVSVLGAAALWRWGRRAR